MSEMILVTGGTGFVGRKLVADLAGCGHAVRVMSRSPRSAIAFEGLQAVALVDADLLDPAKLDAAMADVDTVIHLAGALDGEPSHLRRVNVDGTRNVARAARIHGVRRFVHVSSAGVYGDAPGAAALREDDPLRAATPYELSKLDGERAVREELGCGRTDHLILRPAGVYGGERPATRRFLQDVSTRRLRFSMPPAMIVHPTYVDDMVRAVGCCLGRRDLGAEVFNVGGERAMPLDAWAREVAAAMGVDVLQVSLPSAPFLVSARLATWACRHLGVAPPARLERASHRVLSRALDIGKARSSLGFEPTPLSVALAETVRAARGLNGGTADRVAAT